MVHAGRMRVWAQDVNGAEEHELSERPPWQNSHNVVSTVSEASESFQQDTEEADDPLPSSQANPGLNGPISRPLPHALAPNHGLPTARMRLRPLRPYLGRSRYCSPQRKPLTKAVLCVTLTIAFAVAAWILIRLAEQNPGCNLVDFCPQLQRGKPLQLTLPRRDVKPLPTPIAAVSGFYKIPTATIPADWLQAGHGFFPSVTGKSEIDRLRTKHTTVTFSSAEWTSSEPGLKKENSQSTISKDKFGSGSFVSRKEDTFSRWGVGILYKLHRRALSYNMQARKKWCMDNVCSTSQQLDEMCNNTGRESTERKSQDPFERQECDWCWDESIFPKRNSTQQAEIEQHCEKVAKHAAIVLAVACSFLFVLVFPIAIMFVIRILPGRRKKRADSEGSRPRQLWFVRLMSKSTKDLDRAVPQDHEVGGDSWYLSMFKMPRRVLDVHQEHKPSRIRMLKRRHPLNDRVLKIEGETGDRVPILPPATRSRVISNVEHTGYGNLSGLENNKTQDGNPELPSRFSRRSRPVSSGSQSVQLGALVRKTFIARHGDSEASRGPSQSPSR